MAFSPCTVHGGGFSGGASTFFPALVRGTERFSIRHKACPADATKFHEWAVDHLSLVSEGETFFPQTQPSACALAGDDLVDPFAFFLNEYLRGEPARQFYGQVCAKCAPAVAEDWMIPW